MKRPSRLSVDFVRKLNTPGRYGDGRGSFGLSLLVQPSGDGVSKSWTQRLAQRNGRDTSIGLGGWPTVSLAEAREIAAANALAVKAGEDVLANRGRRASLGLLTFEQAAERTMQTYASSWKTDKTGRVWRSLLAEYVYPSIGALPIAHVTGGDLFRVISPVWATKRAMAVKVKSVINAVYAWATANDLVQTNPLLAVVGALPKAGRQVQHHRSLPWQEVPELLATIEGSSAGATTKLAVRFLALTAARSGEVRGAQWSEVDIEARTWTIPGERMKQGLPHRVPLSPAALAVIEAARQHSDGLGLIFPSRTGRKLSEGALSKLFGDLGIDCVPHGLRSTFRVWADETDVPRDVAEFALAHVVGSASERAYRRSDLYRQREQVMADWADAIA